MTEEANQDQADAERIEVQRTIPADAARIFAVLRDPQGHVTIDSSGMLMDATGEPASKVGDKFVVHMDREALNDYPMGLYDVTVAITAYEQDREIAWTIEGQIKPQIGHVYGYRLEPADGGGTFVTSYYDWSNIDPQWREATSSRSSPRRRCGPPWESSNGRWLARRSGDGGHPVQLTSPYVRAAQLPAPPTTSSSAEADVSDPAPFVSTTR